MAERGVVRRMGRLSVWLVLIACGVTSVIGITGSMASASTPKSAPAPHTSCAKWDITGTWAVIQSNEKTIMTFVFAEKTNVLTGNATLGATKGIINGTLKPDSATFTIKWSNKNVGHYYGKISSRSIVGNTYHGSSKAKWSGTGPTSCRD